MPRSVTLPALQAMLAQHTSEVMIEILEINHTDLTSPLRFCNDSVPLVSNGKRYEPWPFRAVLPNDDPDEEPRASIEISNIDLSVTDALDHLPSKPTITIAVVTKTNPDQFEYGPMTFDVGTERGSAQTIILDLVLQDLDQEPFPAMSFDPVRFPALF